MIRFILAVLLVGLVSCQEAVLRPDPSPAPDNRIINQFRLEFSGCGLGTQVGTIGCIKGQKVEAITEFPGNLTIVSSNNGCSLNEQIRVSETRTVIPRPSQPEGIICAVQVIYRPELPGEQTQATHTLVGQVFWQPDSKYKQAGNFAISTFETKTFKKTGSVRGAVSASQIPVQAFDGDHFAFRPGHSGADVIFLRWWDKDGVNTNYFYTANYYSASARKLLFDRVSTGDGEQLTFPDTVSTISVDGKLTSKLVIQVKGDFTGYIRAYTVQGRSSINYYSKGKLQWTK